MLGKLFSGGAADLVKGVGGVFDNLHTSQEEKLEAERKILMHEMKHMVDMKTGKLSYTDHDITWMGETYERKNGKIKYNGKWSPEGSTDFPWEKH